MAQLYARVFVQILDSSIAEDFMVRHVFEDMMKVCDGFGIVDMTRMAMARRFNVPLEELNQALEKLEGPDPHSRDEEFEGRRIERLDKHRDWGWRILNWEKYDQIRTRADVALRVARHRARKTAQEDGSLPKRPPAPKLNRPVNAEEVVIQGSMLNIPETVCRKFWLHYESRCQQDENGENVWVVGGENNQTAVGDWKSLLASWWVREQEKTHQQKLRRRDRSEMEKEPEDVKLKRIEIYGTGKQTGEQTQVSSG